MGLSADGSQKAFPSRDVDAFIERKRIKITNDPMWRIMDKSEHHVIVAVDPSGGGASAFAICSCLQMGNGHVAVRVAFSIARSPLPRSRAASCPAARRPTSRSARPTASQTRPAPDTSAARSAGT